MTIRTALALAAACILAGPACERIPPSVSVPGYAEKKAAEKEAGAGTLGASTNPPVFFPPQKAAE